MFVFSGNFRPENGFNGDLTCNTESRGKQTGETENGGQKAHKFFLCNRIQMDTIVQFLIGHQELLTQITITRNRRLEPEKPGREIKGLIPSGFTECDVEFDLLFTTFDADFDRFARFVFT